MICQYSKSLSLSSNVCRCGGVSVTICALAALCDRCQNAAPVRAPSHYSHLRPANSTPYGSSAKSYQNPHKGSLISKIIAKPTPDCKSLNTRCQTAPLNDDNASKTQARMPIVKWIALSKVIKFYSSNRTPPLNDLYPRLGFASIIIVKWARLTPCT